MPIRKIRFEQNCIPGTHVSGRLFRSLLAYYMPKIIPTIIGLKESFFMNSMSPI